MATKLQKIANGRVTLDIAVQTFQDLCTGAKDDAASPEVAIGAYDGSAFNVTFAGEAPFSLEIQDKIGPGGWMPISVNNGGSGDANIVTYLSSYAQGFNWRATAAAGGDHISEYATGEILPEDFIIE